MDPSRLEANPKLAMKLTGTIVVFLTSVESYRNKEDGSGISIKLGVDPVLGSNITQFEYTLDVA